MILQELVRLYDRLAEQSSEDPGGQTVPKYGFTVEKVSFCIVIKEDGSFVRVEDVRDQSANSPRAVMMTVPAHAKRTVGITPFFLCDNSTYVLGVDSKEKGDRTKDCHRAFVELHQRIGQSNPEVDEIQSVVKFYKSYEPAWLEDVGFREELISGVNIVFRLDRVHRFIHEMPGVVHAWNTYVATIGSSADSGFCLITGEFQPVAVLHPAVKGVRGGQPTGTSIVSFNLDSFRSFGKEQGRNAPVSELAAFKYVAALNYLTSSRDRKVQIADATTVFWAERATQFENVFGMMFAGNESREEEGEVFTQLKLLRDGKRLIEMDRDIKFFILGLAPNASRVSIRFWLRDSVGEFEDHLAQHLRDCAIEKQKPFDPEVIPIWSLVRESARRYAGSGKDRKQIDGDPNPNLAGALTKAVLTGENYPKLLLSAFVNRVRSDGEINYVRVAAIKAAITRTRRKSRKKEVPMALQKDFDSPGYQLGRLFGAIERAQTMALGDINATVKDRYFGAASSTPARVFPVLLRLAQHYISKADSGGWIDRQIAEIMDGIATFPKFLPLEEQGLFAIGYYHQRNSFYAPKATKEENNG